jgi:hypothetical protein
MQIVSFASFALGFNSKVAAVVQDEISSANRTVIAQQHISRHFAKQTLDFCDD